MPAKRVFAAGLALAISAKADGDGAFGTWTYPDLYGGVSYTYTCDQTVNPMAVNTDLDPFYRTTTEHNFVIGNYRVVGHASNYGYTSVRHDENVPEWLGDAAGEHPGSTSTRQYGLGWGFLFDVEANATVLSTFYEGAGTVESFERSFGLGYSIKKVVKGGFSVQQSNVVPYGDDPVLISTVTITNIGSVGRSIAWIENSGGAIMLMDRMSTTEWQHT
jgi:hypothetical protein